MIDKNLWKLNIDVMVSIFKWKINKIMFKDLQLWENKPQGTRM